MFVVIYRAIVKSGREDEYQKLWHEIATYFIEYCGAIGSCLHKTEYGYWLAYSRWPDKVTHDASWPANNNPPSDTLPKNIKQAIIDIKDCVDMEKKFPEISVELVDDLLIP